MPVHPVSRKGRVVGYRWGGSGKLYSISKYGSSRAKRLAAKQGRAIYASGYKGSLVVRKRRRDGVVQRYHKKR